MNEIQYINIGVQKTRFPTMLPECKLNPDQNWKNKLMAQMEHYKRKAAYYDETIALLKKLLLFEEDSLVGFNVRTTKSIACQLKIDTPLILFSEFEHETEKASGGGYWGINKCKALGLDTYINAPDGEAFYPKEEYKKAGIKLGFIQHKLNPYSQYNENFIPGLSIIDVLMFNGVERTSEMVHDYTIKWVNN